VPIASAHFRCLFERVPIPEAPSIGNVAVLTVGGVTAEVLWRDPLTRLSLLTLLDAVSEVSTTFSVTASHELTFTPTEYAAQLAVKSLTKSAANFKSYFEIFSSFVARMCLVPLYKKINVSRGQPEYRTSGKNSVRRPRDSPAHLLLASS